jgi:lactate dehydrogenase-like 2-hydroxyacid dehydrogenase
VAAAAVGAVTGMLPDELWAGRPALVLGYGRLGRQAARLLRDVHRMRVAVHDPQPAALHEAHRGLSFIPPRGVLRVPRPDGDLIRHTALTPHI